MRKVTKYKILWLLLVGVWYGFVYMGEFTTFEKWASAGVLVILILHSMGDKS